MLHRVVRDNLLTFLEQGARSYINCGDPTLGFAGIRCPACGFERLLPFSCKNRGICPSCTGRRMSGLPR